MRATFLQEYRSKATKNLVYLYEVTGTAAELAAYEEAQGVHFRTSKETGKPLFYHWEFAGNSPNLLISKSGKVFPDMSEFNKMASLAKQFGGNLGQELAKEAARMLLGTKPTSAPVEHHVSEQAEEAAEPPTEGTVF